MLRTNGLDGSVLVVDDDASFRTAVAELLEDAGYAVRGAGTAREALAAIHQERPALVLLDVNLPEISGYEICYQLRAEFGNELAIVFISGDRAERDDRSAGLLLGANDHIAKPFEVDDLLARIRHAIERDPPSRG